ncbi:MAG: type II toxin-antitoxin system RelE/ParE family toxin [Actinomycetes bacterium]|jgi:plasmid stabilization system protein ParE|nr:type II toxin-antitoxin system RelE/ParE family toxin [Actinomycetes bacterium]
MPPKKLKLRLLDSAQIDLEGIALRRMGFVGAQSARKITNKLLDSLELLRSFPEMGLRLPSPGLHAAGYRALIVDYYLCVYRQIDEGIFVYHIADARSDYPQLLKMLPH